MKRAKPYEFTALLLEQYVLADDIDNVGPLLNGLDRAGMEAGQGQGLGGRAGGLAVNAPDVGLQAPLFCRTTLGVGALGPQASRSPLGFRNSPQGLETRMQQEEGEATVKGQRAVLALVGSAFMFSLMTLGVKHLGARLPVAELVLARSIVGLGISLGMARLVGIKPWGKRRGLLALRGLLGTMALGCIFAALKRLPLAEATVLQFLYPTLTAALAWILLGESPNRRSLGALLIGWLGVMVLVRPGSGVFPMEGVLLALAGAVLTSLAYVSVRELARTESPLVIVIWFPMVSALLSLPLVLLHPVAPTGNEMLWLLAVGLFTQAGQLGLTEGLARLPAARATPIGYVQVAFASFWGWWVFGETMGPNSLLGGGLVLVAALLSQTAGTQARGASGKGKG